MIKVLTEVASRRMSKYKPYSNVIKLSSTFMRIAQKEVQEYILPVSSTPSFIFSNDEFKINIFGEIWRVHNQAYRDDSNDEDVETVLYEMYKLATT